jgi:hypothetical protein
VSGFTSSGNNSGPIQDGVSLGLGVALGSVVCVGSGKVAVELGFSEAGMVGEEAAVAGDTCVASSATLALSGSTTALVHAVTTKLMIIERSTPCSISRLTFKDLTILTLLLLPGIGLV